MMIDGIPSVKLTLTSQGTPQVYGFVVTCIPASNGVPLSSTHSYHLWETLTDLPRSFPITFDSVDPQSVDSVYIYISNIYYSDGRIYCREISSPDPQTCRLFSID